MVAISARQSGNIKNGFKKTTALHLGGIRSQDPYISSQYETRPRRQGINRCFYLQIKFSFEGLKVLKHNLKIGEIMGDFDSKYSRLCRSRYIKIILLLPFFQKIAKN
jgi:hypothetical protein